MEGSEEYSGHPSPTTRFKTGWQWGYPHAARWTRGGRLVPCVQSPPHFSWSELHALGAVVTGVLLRAFLWHFAVPHQVHSLSLLFTSGHTKVIYTVSRTFRSLLGWGHYKPHLCEHSHVSWGTWALLPGCLPCQAMHIFSVTAAHPLPNRWDI